MTKKEAKVRNRGEWVIGGREILVCVSGEGEQKEMDENRQT